ncbi:hypothetical protein [Actinophytocola xanthii]|uniref:hypothetical protein n=1 Tax=Actinophytocola xanthii TaxID=1912961 RepID=UPI00117812C5|nr:hypothetical protein [Actinophytocola xanthii]
MGGLAAVGAAGAAALRVAPVLLAAVGLLLLVRALTPSRPVLGPLILVGAGLLWLSVQLDLFPLGRAVEIAPLALVAGGILVAMTERRREDPLASIVRRRTSLFLPRRLVVTGPAPQKLIARCLFGDLVLDLEKATFPKEPSGVLADRLTIDLTVLGGWTEVRLPAEWPVRAGRLVLGHPMALVGELSSRVPAIDEVVSSDEPNLVVLNIQGWLGRVVLTRAR